jgi:4-hydroxy-2-oxoheptanedioate aldolase
MAVNSLKREIHLGTPQLGIWSSLCSNIVADIVSDAGFDWALIDMAYSANGSMSVFGQSALQKLKETPP